MAKKLKKAKKTKPQAKRAPSKPAAKAAGPDPRKQFLDSFEREHATTMKLLAAYPADKLELQPHAKCKTARGLAWMFVMEQGLGATALTKGLDWSKPMPEMPPPPATMNEIMAALDQGHQQVAGIVKGMSDAQLAQTVKFPVAPKTLGDVPKLQFVWMLLCDQIHHRGQFSIYLRMADGKVPSIYGPSADEPWN
jgi:uncharacterized damage-inducible protein DinB